MTSMIALRKHAVRLVSNLMQNSYSLLHYLWAHTLVCVGSIYVDGMQTHYWIHTHTEECVRLSTCVCVCVTVRYSRMPREQHVRVSRFRAAQRLPSCLLRMIKYVQMRTFVCVCAAVTLRFHSRIIGLCAVSHSAAKSVHHYRSRWAWLNARRKRARVCTTRLAHWNKSHSAMRLLEFEWLHTATGYKHMWSRWKWQNIAP